MKKEIDYIYISGTGIVFKNNIENKNNKNDILSIHAKINNIKLKRSNTLYIL